MMVLVSLPNQLEAKPRKRRRFVLASMALSSRAF
jgi:hypothetical protein